MRRSGKRLALAILLLAPLALGLFALMGHRMQRNALDGALPRGLRAAPGGLEVSYFESGNPSLGRIVYVHGSPGNSGAWEDYLLDPVGGLDSIAIDRPGFGQTRPRRPEPSLAVQASALEPFLEPDAAGRLPVLVGHSIGGPVVVRAAVDYPDRVGAIVVVAGSVDPAQESMKWFNDLAAEPTVRGLIPEPLAFSNDEIMPLAGELEMLRDRLDAIRCPVVIVHARDDRLVPFANVDYMRRRFPAGTIRDLILLDDGDHFLPWNRVTVVRGAIEKAVGYAGARAGG